MKLHKTSAALITTCMLFFASTVGFAHEGHDAPAAPVQNPTSLMQMFDKLKTLQGEWVDVDGTFGEKGAVVVSYRVSGNGSAVIETHFPGKRSEMTTVIHRDGADLALTHYCSVGNQPRMRAHEVQGDVLMFEFDGGTNMDVARDRHMHRRQMRINSADDISGQWEEWLNGRSEPRYFKQYHLQRKQPAALI